MARPAINLDPVKKSVQAFLAKHKEPKRIGDIRTALAKHPEHHVKRAVLELEDVKTIRRYGDRGSTTYALA